MKIIRKFTQPLIYMLGYKKYTQLCETNIKIKALKPETSC